MGTFRENIAFGVRCMEVGHIALYDGSKNKLRFTVIAANGLDIAFAFGALPT